MERFSKTLLVLVLLSQPALFCVRNVHITLGDYFVNKSAPVIYRVGFMANTFQDADCVANVKLILTFPDKTTATYGTTNDTRNYSFHGNAVSRAPNTLTGGKTDVDRTFGFVELTKLSNPSQFTYRFEYKGQIVRGPYNFKTRILDKKQEFKVVSFGEHDELVGSPVLTRLANFDVDLVVLTGDYAFDIHSDNGKRGDSYFDAVEPLFTRVPVVLAAGAHEYLDNFGFFSNKFIFPMNKTESTVNNYHFIVNNVLFVTLNFDLILADKDAQNSAFTYLKNVLAFGAKNKDVNHIIFFANRPFLCSNYNAAAGGSPTGCSVNEAGLKPFNDLLQQYNADLVLSGNQQYYERSFPLRNYVRNDQGVTYVIVGTGGNSLKTDKLALAKSDYKVVDIQNVAGFLALDFNADRIHGDFVSASDGATKDSFDIGKTPWYKKWWVWLLIALAALLAGLAAFFAMKRPASGYRPMQEQRVVEERHEVRYTDGRGEVRQEVRAQVNPADDREVRREYKTELVDRY